MRHHKEVWNKNINLNFSLRPKWTGRVKQVIVRICGTIYPDNYHVKQDNWVELKWHKCLKLCYNDPFFLFGFAWLRSLVAKQKQRKFVVFIVKWRNKILLNIFKSMFYSLQRYDTYALKSLYSNMFILKR